MAIVALFSWLVVAAWAPASVAKVAVVSAFVLVVPGYMMFVLAGGSEKRRGLLEPLLYSVGLSLLFLMVVGLLLNIALPPLGIPGPLATSFLEPGIAVGVLGLYAGVAATGRKPYPKFKLKFSFPAAWRIVAGVTTVALSVLGAISLNNGGTNWFSMAALGMFGGLAIWLTVQEQHWTDALRAFVIYCLGLALLFATSLRGWFITGHDIIQEYQVFELTAGHSHWSMSLLHDPYTACLSITILPTILQRLTGLSDPYIYKVLFQLVFALVPVVVYLLASRFVGKAAAAVTAVIYMTFPTFLMDMAMLNRQEVAFLFFGLAFLALFDARMQRRSRLALVLGLFVGMVLSHYSTSYIAITAIVAFKVLEMAVRQAQRLIRRKFTGAHLPLGWFPVLLIVGFIFVWQGPVTHSGNQFGTTVNSISTSVARIVSGTPMPDMNPVTETPGSQQFQAYVNGVVTTRDLGVTNYFDSKFTDSYPPQQAHETEPPLTRAGRWLDRHGVNVAVVLDLAKSGYGYFIELLIILGLMVAIARLWYKIRGAYVLMGCVLLVLIVAQVVLPGAINYGLLRLIQQTLLFLALPMFLALSVIFGLVKIPKRFHPAVAAGVFVAAFWLTSGFAAALVGGYPQSLATANSGFYYEAYYTHADEVAGFNWLAANAPLGSVVDADQFARRKMITYSDIYARSAIAPSVIAQDAYFFLSYGDTTTDSMPYYFGPDLIYQQPPTDFLNATKNMVYTNGQVQIYK